MKKEDLEKMAEAAHNVWAKGKIDQGWKYGEKTDKESKIHSCLVPYNELSEGDKQSDRDLVKGIPDILHQAGFIMISIQDFKEAYIETMEKALENFTRKMK